MSVEQAAARHEQAMLAARATLQEVVDRKEAAIVAMDAELKARLLRLSETQRELIAARADAASSATAHTRTLAADRLGRALERWSAARARAAWNHWRIAAHVTREREGAARARDAALLAARAAADEDKSRTCALLLDEYKTSKDATVLAIQRVERRRIAELELMAAVRWAPPRAAAPAAAAGAHARTQQQRALTWRAHVVARTGGRASTRDAGRGAGARGAQGAQLTDAGTCGVVHARALPPPRA